MMDQEYNALCTGTVWDHPNLGRVTPVVRWDHDDRSLLLECVAWRELAESASRVNAKVAKPFLDDYVIHEVLV